MVDIAIIGGGIAGCMVAYALKRRGADMLLIERHATIAKEASGNPLALVMPQPSLGDTPAARFNADSYLAAIAFYQSLFVPLQQGILQLAVNDDDAQRFQKLAAKNSLAPDSMEYVDAISARDILGLPVSNSAVWYPTALTIPPRQICTVLTKDIPLLAATEALSLRQEKNKWLIEGREQQIIAEASSVIIANAMDALHFSQTNFLPLRARRGQLSFVRANNISAEQRCSFTFGGYMTKPQDGFHILGATYEIPLDDPATLTDKEHHKNLAKLESVMPGLFPQTPEYEIIGRAAIRATTPDHLPIVGAVPGQDNLFVFTGLGSRAFTTAPFCAEMIANIVTKYNESEAMAAILKPYRFIKAL